jgi:hypothetical protein
VQSTGDGAAGLDVAPPVERTPEAMPGVGVRT